MGQWAANKHRGKHCADQTPNRYDYRTNERFIRMHVHSPSRLHAPPHHANPAALSPLLSFSPATAARTTPRASHLSEEAGLAVDQLGPE